MRRDTWLICVLFVGLTIVMTWPQALRLATDARQHHDVYFNIWRLAWAAHALATNPSHLFDGNIFFPEARALTLSDAMLVEAIVAAPLFWMKLPPVLVHNLLLLGAIVASAVGAFVLARHLTGNVAASVVAGIVFAFAPYRFEHYMHMELQWAMWIPWAFWALHRTFESGSWRFGALTGVFVALQMMSSIYYGIFLITLAGLCAVLLFVAAPRDRLARTIPPLAAGAAIAGIVCAAYAMPYLATRRTLGGRSNDQVLTYSATPSSYRVATPENLLYGARSGRAGRPERRLFPGMLALLLAFVAVIRKPGTHATIYLIAVVAAFEMSLGLGGFSYRFLYTYVPLYGGLRAPARLGLFVLLFLGVLAAIGQAALLETLSVRMRRVVAILVPALMLLEYWVAPLALVPFPNSPPPLYGWLATQPRAAVAEFPMPRPDTLPGQEPRYVYMSTFHWKPLVNGYSGYYPRSYLTRLEAMWRFPTPSAIERLYREGVRYVIIHPAGYGPGQFEQVLEQLSSAGAFTELGRFDDGEGTAVVFGLR
jgi:hypothetical protein